MDSKVDAFVQNLLSMNRIKAAELIRITAEKKGTLDCTEEIILPAMEIIGELWETGEIALSQVYMSGRICEEIIDSLLHTNTLLHKDQPEIAIAVFEDYHGLGKRIVSSVLYSAGYAIRDYGEGLSVEQLVAHVKEDKVKVLLLSTLMLNSALNIKKLKEEFIREGIETKIIVGGAPFRFDPELHKRIGVDAMARNASDVVTILREQLKEELCMMK